MSRAKRILGLGAVVLVVAAAMIGGKLFLEHRWRQQLDQRLAGFAPVKVTYGRLNVSLPFYDTHIFNIRVERPGARGALTIREITVDRLDTAHPVPRYLHARIRGVVESLAAAPPSSRRFLHQYGYKTLRGNYEINYEYDPASSILDLRSFIADLQDMGRLEAKLRLQGFELYDAGGVVQPAPDFSVAGGRIEYTDNSLVGRVVAARARQRHMSRTEFLRSLDRRLNQAAARQSDSRLKHIADELVSFLHKPGRLYVTLKPPKPVSLPQIIADASVDPAKLPDLLGLEVRAQPRVRH